MIEEKFFRLNDKLLIIISLFFYWCDIKLLLNDKSIPKFTTLFVKISTFVIYYIAARKRGKKKKISDEL